MIFERRLTGLLGALLATLLLTVVTLAAVDLAYFNGRWQGNAVVLNFGTGSEIDHAGFHVWRSNSDLPIVNGQIDQSQATNLNPSSPIVNPDGFCTQSGQDYSYTDSTAQPAQGSYFYYLESLDCTAGGSTFYGEGDSGLAVSLGTTLYLPVVLQQPASP